ncbi:MAG: LysE family transporter [Flavobacteriaceae bacterium]
MLDDILAAIPLGVLLSFLIGPVFFVLLETSVTKGFRAALVFDLGVIMADILFILIAYFSSYRIIESVKDQPALFIFGGLIMLTYGIISYIKVKKLNALPKKKFKLEIHKKNYWSLLGKGFLLNFVNIGVLGFWLMILITIGSKMQMQTSRIITFFSTLLITYLLIDIGKILLAKQLKNKLTLGKINKIKKITSLILILFGLVIMLQGWFPSERKMVKNALERIDTH